MTTRLRVVIHGAVQGVGFRPFVYRLATEMGLVGWVSNSMQGVFIEVEGAKAALETFLLRLGSEKPPLSYIQSLEPCFLDRHGYTAFEIRKSEDAGNVTSLVLPDIATCPDCRSEIFDPSNRRYLYPFTNCTRCGPRFTIIETLPYDRANTTMKAFVMCDECWAEYNHPLDRRFHAQPNACPCCGPHLELWDARGRVLASDHEALLQATQVLRSGSITAVKGLGGFHLMVDARQEESVLRLRKLKGREQKPFALMYPSLDCIKRDCELSEMEQRLLLSPESPIVLLRRHTERRSQPEAIAQSVAPANPYLGIMLPYTPLHHLLMSELRFPMVATSGNLSDEPICTNEHEALERLGGIADLFLIHNRPIVRHVDDSVVRVMMGRELVLRRARGYAPLPVHLAQSLPAALAVGAHLKNTIATSVGSDVFVSQHIGDLETPQALAAFHRVIASFQQLYHLHPTAVVCDAHPGYLSTQFAQQYGLPVLSVQHHYAHILSCMAENELQGPILGVSWDGTGYGDDQSIWGGEFLRVTRAAFSRVAHLRTFALPGGAKAIKEPRRAALGLLYELFGEGVFCMRQLAPIRDFSNAELRILQTTLGKKINSPVTSSAGRLFDAVAAILGLRQQARFEGQAAMELEFALGPTETEETYPFQVLEATKGGKSRSWNPQSPSVVDWAAMIHAILEDLERRLPSRLVSAKFHNTLAEMIVEIAKRAGEKRVALSGGCFQNRYLTERTIRRLQSEGFRPYWHQRIPPNDGGIALGQIIALARAESGISKQGAEIQAAVASSESDEDSRTQEKQATLVPFVPDGDF